MEVPRHLASQVSDVQLRMLRIKHPNKHQEYFEVFRKLKHNEVFTDVNFVTKTPGRTLSIHKLVLASYSPFIKSMIGHHDADSVTILLPEIDYSDVEALCHILYGVDVAVPRSRFYKIFNLAEMLGIPASKLKTPEDFLLDPNEPRLASASLRNGSNSETTTPPLCCWHCNRTFTVLENFQEHLESHKGEKYKSKRHKCQKCKKIFPTMWKLRTHLLTHASPKKLSKRGDHEYAEPLKKAAAVPKKAISDHPYANPTDAIPAPATQVAAAQATVNKEHSYGTRQRLASISKGDHAYSSFMPMANGNNVELVQLLSVVRHEPLPPGSSVIALGPQEEAIPAALKGSAKRKADLKSMEKKDDVHEIAADERDAAKSYPCKECGKTFPQPYRRQRHVLEVHKNEKRHTCIYCEKSFFKLSSKKRHELTHVPHQAWKCEKCQKAFKDASSLKYHAGKKVCKK